MTTAPTAPGAPFTEATINADGFTIRYYDAGEGDPLVQAAHNIQDDRPEAFAELVDDFLTRGWSFLLPEESTLINP